MDVEVTFSSSQLEIFAERMGRRAAVRTYRVAEFAAQEMERNYVDIVSAEFINDRAEHRRKGTLPLIESAEGVVEGVRGELPVTASLRTVAGADTAKVGALEYGSPSHEIAPTGQYLRFPKGRDKWSQAYGNNDFKTSSPVQHGGNREYGMMRRARGAAIEAVRRFALQTR